MNFYLSLLLDKIDNMSTEPVIFNPWNPKAKLITQEKVEKILSSHEIPEKISDLKLYQRAFIHKSYIKKSLDLANEYENDIEPKPTNCLDLQPNSYERLEYLGDAILSATIASYLFERFPDADEGFLTRMRTKLVNGEMLGSLGQKMKLDEHIVISQQVLEKNNFEVSYKLVEDIFEAFIGALFLDFNEEELEHPRLEFYSGLGFQICQTYIINVIEKYVDFAELILNDYNYKDKLMKYFQRNNREILKYKDIVVEGNGPQKTYTVCVTRGDESVLAYGKGPSKKKAEQCASKNALQKLDLLD